MAQKSLEQTGPEGRSPDQADRVRLEAERQGLWLPQAAWMICWIRARPVVPTALLARPDWPGSRQGSAIGAGLAPMEANHLLWVDNILARQFDVQAPDTVWVTANTYIKTMEGFAYLAVVIDLFSRRVIGWSLQSRQTSEVVPQVLYIAVWRRKPQTTVLVHSDQGSQFTSID